MKLKDVLRDCFLVDIPRRDSYLENEIRVVTTNLEEVTQDSLFIARDDKPPLSTKHLEEAVSKGAVGLVVATRPEDIELPYILVADTRKALAQITNAFYDYPSQQLKIVGVTGTNGKTTITHLVSQIAEHLGDKTGIIGTIYDKVDQQRLPTTNTTPDSQTIQQLFKQMTEAKVSVCGMEVSSHGLALGRTFGIDFDIAVFTNFSQDHLDFHGTMAEYFFVKSLFFAQLGNYYGGKRKLAVLNRDDEYGRQLSKYTSMNVLTYGCQGQGDLQATKINVTADGTAFEFRYQRASYQLKTQLIGRFNVYNILATIGSCLGLGYSVDSLVQVIQLLEPVRGRFELVENAKGITAVVDYAHTPDGLKHVLSTAKGICSQKLYCVVGCGGDRDPSKRTSMADVALVTADRVIFTSDNPRSEEPAKIVQEMVAETSKTNYRIELDRQVAIEHALALAQPGDLVLVAGKGHETYQLIGEETIDFDDRQIIRDYLK